jgi:hypothetical protein
MSWTAAHPFLTVAVGLYGLIALGCLLASLAEMTSRSRLRAGPVLMAATAAAVWPVTLLVLSAWSTSPARRRGPGGRNGAAGAPVSSRRLRTSA